MTMPILPPERGLIMIYRRLIGSAWDLLDPRLQQFHRGIETMALSGMFDVRRGRSLLSRLIAPLVGLPSAGRSVPVRVVIAPGPTGERWARDFDGTEVVTHQRERDGAILEERFGPFELWFALDVKAGALRYRQIRAAYRLFGAALPLPPQLQPRIAAREWPAGGRRIGVSVRVGLPLVGLLVAYRGWIALPQGAA